MQICTKEVIIQVKYFGQSLWQAIICIMLYNFALYNNIIMYELYFFFQMERLMQSHLVLELGGHYQVKLTSIVCVNKECMFIKQKLSTANNY